GPNAIAFSPSSPAEVREGSNLTVNCIADCLPPCSYSWTWKNENISSTALLALENIKKKQTGVYTCYATNTFTSLSDHKTFELTVLDDPERMSALNAGAISGIVIAVVLALAIPTVWILYKRIKRQQDIGEENIDNRTQKSEVEKSEIDNPAFTQPD
ncbi:carcinoembryonic antigen-related cell adhesion molecule 20-like, partial [Gigantopelta aegis]|uniref:carcinoembryonic antigen-related cell adhesion molecule 20-like n=1 Tax=Gigantopelta aegis TaxID=1735272 RepID=UPI001B88E69C